MLRLGRVRVRRRGASYRGGQVSRFVRFVNLHVDHGGCRGVHVQGGIHALPHGADDSRTDTSGRRTKKRQEGQPRAERYRGGEAVESGRDSSARRGGSDTRKPSRSTGIRGRERRRRDGRR